MKKHELQVALQRFIVQANEGCSDHNCHINPKDSGQGTNGGCLCSWSIARGLSGLAMRVKTEGVK